MGKLSDTTDSMDLLCTVDSRVETARLNGSTMTLVHLSMVMQVNGETGEGEPLRFALNIPRATWEKAQPGKALRFTLAGMEDAPTPPAS